MATSAAGLAKDLKAIAVEEARQAGMNFTHDCLTNHLGPFLDLASTRVFDPSRSSNDAAVAYLEAATRFFVAMMLEEANRRGLPELQEITFLSIRATFCPCFPLC